MAFFLLPMLDHVVLPSEHCAADTTDGPRVGDVVLFGVVWVMTAVVTIHIPVVGRDMAARPVCSTFNPLFVDLVVLALEELVFCRFRGHAAHTSDLAEMKTNCRSFQQGIGKLMVQDRSYLEDSSVPTATGKNILLVPTN